MKHIIPLLIACTLFCTPSAARRRDVRINADGTDITIYAHGIADTVRLFVISDTHLYRSDEREDPYREYSHRMAHAYNSTVNFKTGQRTNPEEAFLWSLGIASDWGADAIVHLGDLVSYPSEAGVEFAVATLNGTGIPWYCIPGNHDWHYEGMEGTEKDLRDEWVERRLAPLLGGRDPLNYAVDVKGLRLLLVSDGINEILPSQVGWFRRETRTDKPSLLMMHIPLAAEGRAPRSFTIGSPLWGWDCDMNYKYERRPRWPREGHSKADYDFRRDVLKAGGRGGLLAVVCGHVHFQSTSILEGGLPMFTLKENAAGGYCRITVLPADRISK